MKAYRGSRNVTPVILNLRNRIREWLVSRPDSFIPGKELRYLLDGRMGGP
jgi:hypothetical protein